VLSLVDALAAEGIALSHIDLGGGLGIQYEPEDQPPTSAQYAAAVLKALGSRQETLLFEPGRFLTGNAGVLLARVEYLKRTAARNFAIVDAAMNDLMRPALYDAWHDIVPVRSDGADADTWDVVGPVCESGDFLARARKLALREDAIVAIRSAGAYGMSMSSNYNTRPRAAEIMVKNGAAQVIRKRESIASLFADECVLT
jgi:diaminopimelate decarboxylase